MARHRILIFHPALATYRADLFNRLHKELDLLVVFFNDVVAYHRDLDQGSLRDSLHCRVKFLVSGFRFAGREFRTGMGRIIEEFQPDAVVTHEFSYATLAIMLNRSFFSKHKYNHLLWTAESPHMLRSRGAIRLSLRRLFSKNTDCMIVYSEAVKEAFRRRIGIPLEQMFVCANLQDETTFAAKLNDARTKVESQIQQYDLADKKIVLFVGRLDPVKNLERLFEAFSRISKEVPNALLVLVGDGPERNKLEMLAIELDVADQTLFVGHCEGDALYAWYLLGSTFALTSVSETYGAVVNEALLSGVPVICSSHAGASVLIKEGGNGWICDPYDVEQIAELLQGALAQAETVQALVSKKRKNLMPVPFERDVQSFVAAVKHICNAA
jgi:glycosyltransferase involved in cell wall biosynthesis